MPTGFQHDSPYKNMFSGVKKFHSVKNCILDGTCKHRYFQIYEKYNHQPEVCLYI